MMTFALCLAAAITTRGVVLTPKDLSGELDWPKLAHDAGLTTIGTHVGPADVMPFLGSEKGKKFLSDCKRYGIDVEHELHAMGYLLPRKLFDTRPELFRMEKDGKRVREQNCCASSPEALAIIASNAVEVARVCRPTTGRYFYWLDDSSGVCHCPKCSELNAADQALLIENAILGELRAKVDPRATLAHLAYGVTMNPPEKVKPANGIFLEFADIGRRRDKWLDKKQDKLLRRLLEIFPVETAQVLEYWLDVSLFSEWHRPYVKLPWSGNLFRRDVDNYAKLGFRKFTTFAVYLDDDYVRDFGRMPEVLEYGRGLNEWPYAGGVPAADRFGVPGCVEFTKDDVGEEVMVLSGRGGRVEVSLRGAHVRSWRPKGQDEVLYCPPTMKFDGKEIVRGGIPLSWPWFGHCGEPGSVDHGFARHCLFEFKKCKVTTKRTWALIRLVGAEWNKETKDLWPERIHLDYEISLAEDGTLELKATTTNIGQKPYVVTEGLHPYWKVSDRNWVKVMGLDGVRYCDSEKTQTPNETWVGDFVPDRHFDHVFWTEGKGVTIDDPGMNRRISIESVELPRTVIWTPAKFLAGDFENLPPEDMLKFVCVEPGRLFRPDAYVLEPKSNHVFKVTFKCTANL